MNKPEPKREAAVDRYHETAGSIDFYASPDALEDIKEFGYVLPDPIIPNRYILYVDKRYNFQEVLAYIEKYG